MKFKVGDKIVALPNAPYDKTTSNNGYGIVFAVFKYDTSNDFVLDEGEMKVRWFEKGVIYKREDDAPVFIVCVEHFKLMVKRWKDEI